MTDITSKTAWRDKVRYVADRLEGPLMKLHRARGHLEELREQIEAYHATKPYVVLAEADHERGLFVHRLMKADSPPKILAAIAGDVVHNLRSALDGQRSGAKQSRRVPDLAQRRGLPAERSGDRRGPHLA